MKELIFAVLVTAAVATPASAGTIVWLDTCSPECYTQTRLSITPDARHDETGMWGGDVMIEVISPTIYGNNALGFNVAGTGVRIFDITPSSYALGGTNEEIGPFGSFEYLIDGPAPLTNIERLTFWIGRDGGFSDAESVFEANELGFLVGANSYSWAYNPAVPRYEVGETFTSAADGFGDMSPTPVPEPGTMILLATGLAAAWRKRRSLT